MTQYEIDRLRKGWVFVTNEFEFIPVNRNGKLSLERARVVKCSNVINLFSEHETTKDDK